MSTKHVNTDPVQHGIEPLRLFAVAHVRDHETTRPAIYFRRDDAERHAADFVDGVLRIVELCDVDAERERWQRPAFLWPAAMPDAVARWVSANVSQVVPRD
jgi:hypothetical protein